MKTPDYLSYDRYKKKKKSNSSTRVSIFITTFFVTLLLFMIAVKNFSPDVDVTIGESTQTDVKETGLGVKRFIDGRLKMIQMEDNTVSPSSKKDENKDLENEEDSEWGVYPEEETVYEEVITLPNTQSHENRFDKSKEEETDRSLFKFNTQEKAEKHADTAIKYTQMIKVYVGHYSTIEQAKVSQEILMDSGLGITPFIKDLGRYYTLQIGSYLNKAKAESLVSELQRNGFPARWVQE